MAAKICSDCGRSNGKNNDRCRYCNGELQWKEGETPDAPEFSDAAVEAMERDLLGEPLLPNEEPRPAEAPASIADVAEKPHADAPPSGPAAEARPEEESAVSEVAASAPTPTTFTLVVRNGKHAGKRIPLRDATPIVVGTAGPGEGCLDGDMYMSGHHASFSLVDGHVEVADQESSNGTYLRVQGRIKLGPGSVLLLGQTQVEIAES